ncbi:PREDICTED: WD repeat-containing protein 34-like isoform X5 [Branchiostoma belcheri]|uniref:WD repeat-containing protein 34-like isoform X4 n=1 Tax=Branchiostoma belcheri TaxID=7741 RepID=A0A6P4Z267_BRABE|nr:PREDICTED: WD repeat-containing protein 34-like isoform X4 [Branchiostoma belcheri]XP_019635655.1 PREDICTED: WD repeat-containing protein 34-like isoform X5 [Branchiostoma belcheri]
MFSDETLDVIEFKSSWKKERRVRDGSTQTSEIITNDVAAQSVDRHEIEVQTDELYEKATPYRFVNDKSQEYQELRDFLARVEPMLHAQLEKNLHSHAFDGYDVNWHEETKTVTCVHTLSHADLEPGLNVTGLSWNSTGSTVAVSYGRFDHEDWCTHKSLLCTWNVDRKNINPKKADVAVDVSSCLMCVAFHPEIPAFIAGGTFNGEVQLWDLSQPDNPLLASSGIEDDSHRDPVSRVVWVLDPEGKGKNKYKLVSISGDGKILVWQASPQSKEIKLLDGFLLLAESMPRSMRKGRLRPDAEMGVTAISYTHEDKTLFVVGSEGGGVFKCSMNSSDRLAAAHIQSSVPLKNPVSFAFTPHVGPVYAVECSPYHRNLFLTCGIDQTARVYSMLQTKPVLELEPAAGYIFSARWSPVRPSVFAVVTGEGQLLIYDLVVHKVNPVCTLEAGSDKKPVYTLEFNLHNRQLLATGDELGHVRVWQLNDELTLQDPGEETVLADLADTALE